MIITELAGGLGNQMFQYAAGKALSLKHKTDFRMDRSFLDRDAKGAYTQRSYELDIFSFSPSAADEDEIHPFKRNAESRIYRGLCRTFPFLFDSKFIAENTHQFMSRFWQYGPNAYLHGFWQSEKYFAPYADVIRNDFEFKAAPSGKNIEWLDLITKTHSVSLHVRRGDYVSDKTINTYHGLIGMDYYKAALREVEKTAGAIELFVFSDDIEWCRKHLLLGYPTHFVDHNIGASNFEDMRLMSNCKHNIIANSSFSWWGAWLNRNPQKVVVAPAQWFRQAENSDIYPSAWIKL